MATPARNSGLLVLTTVLCLAAIAPAAFAQVTVTDAVPGAAAPGTMNLQVTISGSGFKRGAKASFVLSGTNNPGDIVVSNTAFVGSSQVTATISVAATASNATYDIVVMNTNGSSGKGTELFGVNNNVNKNGSINVLATVYDTDANGATLLLRGDNPGAGQAGYGPTSNIYSQVWANLWDLDLRNQTTRAVYLTFASPAAGSPASPLPDGYYDARVMTRCFDANNNIFSLFAIPLGMTNNRCSLRVLVPYNGTTYVFVMTPDQPGTGYANVTCTAANATGCTGWHVEPNMDSVIFPGNVPTVAMLAYPGKNPTTQIIVGYYYNTYRIDFHE